MEESGSHPDTRTTPRAPEYLHAQSCGHERRKGDASCGSGVFFEKC